MDGGAPAGNDETNDRLGHFDAFLSEAQADHADDLVDDEEQSAYELPAIIMATELDEADGDVDQDDRHDSAQIEARTLRPDELEVGDPQTDLPVVDPPSEDVLEELRRADIDGPTVPLMPHDVAPSHRRVKRPADYDPAPMPIPLNVPRSSGANPGCAA